MQLLAVSTPVAQIRKWPCLQATCLVITYWRRPCEPAVASLVALVGTCGISRLGIHGKWGLDAMSELWLVDELDVIFNTTTDPFPKTDGLPQHALRVRFAYAVVVTKAIGNAQVSVSTAA